MSEEIIREKPPLGLMPEPIHKRNRAIDILSAMFRYVEADKTIPHEWADELMSLYGKGITPELTRGLKNSGWNCECGASNPISCTCRF